MKFFILGAAMIAAVSAIIAQIDPITGEIINSLPGILVSKRRLAAPLPTYLPDDPYDWLTGILVSKKEAVSSLVRREVLDAAVDSSLLSSIIVSKKEAISSLVRKGAIDDAIDDLTSLTKKEAIESLVVRKRAAIDTLDTGLFNSVISK